MAAATTVLIADDEKDITDVCRRYLEREGYGVLIANDGNEALDIWKANRPGLVILDLMMPGKSGWDVCTTIRHQEDVPIIMLTARGEESDRIMGLTLGADDYLTKPFSPRELVLRVRNLLRRTTSRNPIEGSKRGETVREDLHTVDKHFEGLSIYPSSRMVMIHGQAVELTVKEFDLLYLFVRHPGQVFSRNQLLSRVWDMEFVGDTTTVTVHIRRLREKIESQPSSPQFLKTVWGIGYKFEGKSI